MSVVGCMGVESSGEGAGETSLGGSESSANWKHIELRGTSRVRD